MYTRSVRGLMSILNWFNILIHPHFSNTHKRRTQIEYLFMYAPRLHRTLFRMYYCPTQGEYKWILCKWKYYWIGGIIVLHSL